MSGKGYSSGWLDCANDVPGCLFVWCCVPCAVCDIAEKTGASGTHGVGGVIMSILATSCWLCSLCCCRESIWPCFISDLQRKQMAKLNITVYPEPCGDSEMCGCLLQNCCPIVGITNMCLMYREAQIQ